MDHNLEFSHFNTISMTLDSYKNEYIYIYIGGVFIAHKERSNLQEEL